MTTTSPAPDEVVALDGAFRRIPIHLIDPGPNHRGDLGDTTDLARSLRAVGQLQPITVESTADGRYRLIDGHRRHNAAPAAGLPHLDAVVRQPPGDDERALKQLAIQGNARRFNPMAEARALHSLMFDRNMNRDQIAAAVGRSPLWVRDRVSLVHLEPGEQRQVTAGQMSVAEALLRLKNRRELREGRPPVTARPAGTRLRAAAPAARRTTAPTPAPAAVTGQQRQALELIAAGNTTEEIAAAMHVSPSTAKNHLDRLYRALGACNAAHAVHLAYQRGVLQAAVCGQCTGHAGQEAGR